jgi:hypothetical protein
VCEFDSREFFHGQTRRVVLCLLGQRDSIAFYAQRRTQEAPDKASHNIDDRGINIIA